MRDPISFINSDQIVMCVISHGSLNGSLLRQPFSFVLSLNHEGRPMASWLIITLERRRRKKTCAKVIPFRDLSEVSSSTFFEGQLFFLHTLYCTVPTRKGTRPTTAATNDMMELVGRKLVEKLGYLRACSVYVTHP